MTDAAQKLFDEYQGWAIKLAHHWLNTNAVQASDHDLYVNSALIGLWNAATRFDPARGRTFKCFATPRVKGQIYDDARDEDFVSRSMRKSGRIPRHFELDSESMDGLHGPIPDDAPSIERKIDSADQVEFLTKGMKSKVLRLRYFKDMDLKSIGKRLGFSESRAAQIHTADIFRLRRRVRLSGECM